MRNSFAENYDKGMKKLIKISKNPNAKLYSDIEEKGKGKRLKKPNKHFNESDKENQSVKKRRRHVQSMLPPLPSIPKITNMCNLSQANQLLPEKMDKVIACTSKCTDEVCSSLDNSEQELLSSYDVNETPSKSYMASKKIKFSQEDSSLTETHQSTFNSSERICHSGKISSNGCKIQSKLNHNCCYTSEGKVTLESLADAICHFSGMLQLL